MKCIHCSTDSKYSERSDGKCSHCQRAFAFEPKKGDKLTDSAFASAIDRVSSGGKVKWTRHHLYYEVARRIYRRSKVSPWVYAVAAVVTLPLGVWFNCGYFLCTPIFVALTVGSIRKKVMRLGYDDFEKLWQKWIDAHGLPKGLIARKPAPAASSTTTPRAVPPDLHHYSFDRAVVSDRPETVDLLLANDFHFENNCAIFTAGGYPEEAFETVRAMLRNNPKLTVYVLHDATVEGCLLAGDLRERAWFLPSARIIDVGLRPGHAPPFKGCWREALAPSPKALSRLPKHDAAWLSRYALELAVVRPEQTIKRLFRAMSGEADSSDGYAGDSGGTSTDSSSFSSDASASDGGGDSFG